MNAASIEESSIILKCDSVDSGYYENCEGNVLMSMKDSDLFMPNDNFDDLGPVTKLDSVDFTPFQYKSLSRDGRKDYWPQAIVSDGQSPVVDTEHLVTTDDSFSNHEMPRRKRKLLTCRKSCRNLPEFLKADYEGIVLPSDLPLSPEFPCCVIISHIHFRNAPAVFPDVLCELSALKTEKSQSKKVRHDWYGAKQNVDEDENLEREDVEEKAYSKHAFVSSEHYVRSVFADRSNHWNKSITVKEHLCTVKHMSSLQPFVRIKRSKLMSCHHHSSAALHSLKVGCHLYANNDWLSILYDGLYDEANSLCISVRELHCSSQSSLIPTDCTSDRNIILLPKPPTVTMERDDRNVFNFLIKKFSAISDDMKFFRMFCTQYLKPSYLSVTSKSDMFVNSGVLVCSDGVYHNDCRRGVSSAHFRYYIKLRQHQLQKRECDAAGEFLCSQKSLIRPTGLGYQVKTLRGLVNKVPSMVLKSDENGCISRSDKHVVNATFLYDGNPKPGEDCHVSSFLSDLRKHGDNAMKGDLLRWQMYYFPAAVQSSSLNECDVDNCTARAADDTVEMLTSIGIDNGDYDSAIRIAMSSMFSSPSSALFRCMLHVLTATDNAWNFSQAYALLMGWVIQFPPVTQQLCDMYGQALDVHNWDMVSRLIEKVVLDSQQSCNTNGISNTNESHSLFILRIILAVFERNFLHILHNTGQKSDCLVVRCLWSPLYHVSANTLTAQLMCFTERALGNMTSPTACWRELLCLVSMMVQCHSLADHNWHWTCNGSSDYCSLYIMQQLSQTIKGALQNENRLLQSVLLWLQPPWLVCQISANMLQDFDDFFVLGRLPTCALVSLKMIVNVDATGGYEAVMMTSDRDGWFKVSKYFFLVPCLAPHSQRDALRLQGGLVNGTDTADDHTFSRQRCISFSADSINKQNHKGETMLHTVAIANNVSLLRHLLTIPVFVGTGELGTILSGEFQKVRSTDVCLANYDGVTALHDAVDMNEADTVKLLLKYGGCSLLRARTKQGQTVMDLANTDHMYQLLLHCAATDFTVPHGCPLNEIQCSYAEAVPTDYMYELMQTVHSGSQEIVSSCQAKLLLTLLISLLRSHLQVLRYQPAAAVGSENCIADPAFHMRHLTLHLKRLTSDTVFEDLLPHLSILEALLSSDNSCQVNKYPSPPDTC